MFLALLVAAAAAMIVRYRRATDPVLRAQLRWFALAAAFLPLTLLLCWTSYLLLGDADLVVFGLALTLLALPTATAIALLRHDLYDVDRAVSAAATYGLVSTALLAVFTTVTVVAGALLGRDSAIVAAIATGVSAVALAPLRTRLQRRVDARLYPLRQAVRAELARLRTRIDDGRARPEDLEDTLRRALRDPELRVGYVLPGRPGLVDLASAPLPVGEGRQVPVHVGDTPVGTLLPVRTEASRELLREIASDVGLIVELIRSRLELTEALREVADSRARILHAGYRERRRLERDLHDGAQQRLVSLGMAVRLAQRHLGDPGFDVNGLLDQAVAELSTAVAELRAIAQRPAPARPRLRARPRHPLAHHGAADPGGARAGRGGGARRRRHHRLLRRERGAGQRHQARGRRDRGGVGGTPGRARPRPDQRRRARRRAAPSRVRGSPGWSTGSRPRAGGSRWSRGTAPRVEAVLPCAR